MSLLLLLLLLMKMLLQGGGEQRGAAGDKVDAWRRLFSAAAGSPTP